MKDEPGSNVTVPACTSLVTGMSLRGDWWGHRGQPGSGSSELLSQPRAGDGHLSAATPWDTKHTFHLPFDPIIPSMNMTELVPHSFSLLEAQPESSLSKVSFLPLEKIFWAKDHLSPSKWMVPSTSREADAQFRTGAPSKSTC